MTTPAWISLGSNLGDRRAILEAAVESLARVPGVDVVAVSSHHETQPVGGPPGQGPFLNAAAALETTLEPRQLLDVLQRIEAEAGRVRLVRWGERTLDLDLLIHGTRFLDTEALRLPHPRLAFRRFVLEPLAEIAPTVVDPMTKRSIADLLANLDRRPRLIAIDGPEGWPRTGLFERLVGELPGFGISEVDLGDPVVGEVADPLLEASEVLERKAGALKARLWAIETLRVPWLVTDYFLDLDILRATSKDLWKDRAASDSEARARFEAHREWKRRLGGLASSALRPTLVVILPRGRDLPRRPGIVTVPRLWPDSDDPDALFAEVLATCRGIEGGRDDDSVKPNVVPDRGVSL